MTNYIVKMPFQDAYTTILTEMSKQIAGKLWMPTYKNESEGLLLFQTNWEVRNLLPASLEGWKQGRVTTTLQVSVQFQLKPLGAATLLTTNIDQAAPLTYACEVEIVVVDLTESVRAFLKADLINEDSGSI